MLCGIESRWKIPVGYIYTRGSFASQPMIEQLSSIIGSAKEIANVNTCGMANDQGSSNAAVWKDLGIDLSRNKENPLEIKNYFVLNGQTIYAFADFEHVIKNWRNAWFNRNKGTKKEPSFNFKLSEASFSKYREEYGLVSRDCCIDHVKALFAFDECREYKLAPHLTRECFELTSLSNFF